jgi:Na+-driven multidrug efflux pump
MPGVEAVPTYVPGTYCSFYQILGLAIPAVALNAAAPATATAQTVLLGRLEVKDDGRQQLAAFSAVCVIANFVTFLLNFMVDGVSARLGRSAGQHRWGEMANGVRASLIRNAYSTAQQDLLSSPAPASHGAPAS